MLDTAIQLASNLYTGKTDQSGSPLILHSLRIMMKFEEEKDQICALLHGIVEDKLVDLDLLTILFGQEISNVVDCLTKRELETTQSYIVRLALNSSAKLIKVFDIEDNFNHTEDEEYKQSLLAELDTLANICYDEKDVTTLGVIVRTGLFNQPRYAVQKMQ